MKRIFGILGMLICMCVGTATAADVTTSIGPVDNYGFVSSPDGATWTYTAQYSYQDGYPNGAEIKLYNENNQLIGSLNETFEIEETDLWIRQIELNPLVTKKFFNSDNNLELMLFISVATKDYTGRFYNSVYSLTENGSKHVCNIDGNQVLAKNISTNANDNYTMAFFRQEYREENELFYLYDIYGKAAYGDSVPTFKHTIEIPYQNIAALNDPMPIFLVQGGKYAVHCFVAQYEKPFFVPGTPLNEDPIVNENNNFVITRYDDQFNVLSETKIPMVKNEDSAFLYTYYYLGSLNGQSDVILDYAGSNEPTFIITHDNYETASDGSVFSYYVYNAQGEQIGTIAENSLGTLRLSPVAGQETQYGFMKYENDVEYLEMVDVPSCEVKARIPFYNGGATLSGNWDRVAYGEDYMYVCSLLQGENAEDGSIIQRIAWFNSNGKLHHYDALNLGKNVETAMVNIHAPVIEPRLFDSNNAYEYMVLLKRSQEGKSAKEEALLICNNEGETILDLGVDVSLGGNLSMIDVMNPKRRPQLLCAYSDGKQYTLNYYDLPLKKSELKGQGTAEDPYQISSVEDFMQVDEHPSAVYQVVNNINFGGIPFKGLKKTFTGKLDGGNYTLSNLYLDGNGLFASVQDSATICNLHLYNPQLVLNAQHSTAGFVVSYIQGGMNDEGDIFAGTIRNVHLTDASVVAPTFRGVCGGLVGEASLFVNIEECSVVNAVFEAPHAEQVGGIAGTLSTSSNVQACAFAGSIEGGMTVGGIVAMTGSGEPVKNCHVDADLTGKKYVGGVVGYSGRSKVENCYVEGQLSLAETCQEGGVGGIIGRLEVDAAGASKDTVAMNNVVAVSSITAPTGQDVAAHRVVGFSSCNTYEWDWDKVDYSKPQSEWPRDYYKAEKYIVDNYVVGGLAVLDESIAAEHNTTEGADAELSAEWLEERGFMMGEEVSAPWLWENDLLQLWFEMAERETAVDNVIVNGAISYDGEKLMGEGMIEVYNLQGMLMLKGDKQVNTTHLKTGVYVVRVGEGDSMTVVL